MLKKITISIILFVSLFFNSKAQTTLVAGDIAIVAYNADEVGNEDEFSFILLRDIAAGTVIRFTDFGWASDINGFQSANPCGAGTGSVSDGAITWTAPAGGLLCGTQVHIVCGGLTLSTSAGTVAGLQQAFNFPGEFISLSPGGDQIFAFQGTLAAPTLITAINMNGAWDASLLNCTFTATQSVLPAALSAATSIAIVPEIDNTRYNCTVTNDSPTNLRAAIFNNANWTGNDVTPFIQPLACTYGCSACATPTLTLSAQTNISCNGGSNGSATMTASGGGPYTYAWSPSGGTAATATGLSVGVYTCVVTNSCSATASQTVSITQPVSALSATSSKTNVSCFGGSNGTATVVASGGTTPYSYSWAPSGGTAATATGLAAGNYTCNITDANSCTTTRTFTISQPASALTATSSQTNVSCFGGSNGTATVVASGGTTTYSYAWSPSGGAAATATGLAAGNYTCTITDANSCTTTRTFTISQPASALSATTSQTNVSCFGGSNGTATVVASGGTTTYSYAWSPSGGAAATATGLAAGNYTCTITDANSCTTTRTFTISQPASALTATSSQTNVSCFGGSNGTATVVASGGTTTYSYAWSPSGGTAATATGRSAGNYTCTITDANSCTTTRTFAISQPASALSATSSQTNVSCFGGSNGTATVVASGGTAAYSYAWSPSGGAAATATGLAAGNYTCNITDANSCTTTRTFTISQPASALSATSSQTNVSCFGGSNGTATVVASGGTTTYSYAWSPSGGAAATATGLVAGNYTCTITDANSCTTTRTFTITQPASALAATSSQTNVSCFGGSNGTATVVASGGTATYSYAWSPSGGAAATATGLAAGNYTCTITDANSCTAQTTFNITEPTVLSASSTAPAILCNGDNTVVTVLATGGTTTYTGTGTFTVTAGSYTYTVADANGCSTTTSIIVSEPSAITGSQTLTLCAGQSVTVGSNTYTASGVYTDVLTAANGCDSTVTTNLTVNPAITGSQTFTLCAGQTVTVGTSTYTASGVYTDVLTATNGCDSTVTTNLTVNPTITGSQTLTLCAGQSVTVGSNTYNTSGVYTDVLTAANGCDSTVTTSLTVNPAIIGSQILTLCAGQTVTVGSNTYTTSGVYTDVLTAANGCDSTVTTNLTVNPAITGSQTITLCAGQSLTVGSNTYNTSGVYTDVLTAANGCDSTVTTNLNIENAIDISTSTSGETITSNATSATYQWIDCNNSNQPIASETNQSFTASVNGNYSVIVTQNACSDTSVCINISTVGISKLNNLVGITLYPNPTNSSFTISGIEINSTISIYSIIGELVKSIQSNENKTTIDLSDYSNGIYFIKIKNSTGEAIQKIIKQ